MSSVRTFTFTRCADLTGSPVLATSLSRRDSDDEGGYTLQMVCRYVRAGEQDNSKSCEWISDETFWLDTQAFAMRLRCNYYEQLLEDIRVVFRINIPEYDPDHCVWVVLSLSVGGLV